MPAQFIKRGIEENTWQPEVCGVDFSERLVRKLGEWAGQVQLHTAWVKFDDDEYGEGYTMQLTQENCRVFISELDDEADTISIKDRRDGQWFIYPRHRHAEHFDQMAETVMAWSVFCHSIAPQEDLYQKYLDEVTIDLGDFEVPDDWDENGTAGTDRPGID